MAEQTCGLSTNTIPREDIVGFGHFLSCNFVTISDGRVFLVMREKGTRKIKKIKPRQDSVLSYFFGAHVNAPNGHSKELAERIGESDYLDWWRKRDAMMPSNDAISSRDRNGLDIEDIVTYTTKERWDYMSRIASGDIKVMGFKRFQGGDFILVTDAGRMFYGRNGILECELDRLTLREKRDEFIPATAFVGFGRKRVNGYRRAPEPGNGSYTRNRDKKSDALPVVEDKSVEDLFANALISVADGESCANDYKDEFGERMHWLQDLEQARASFDKGRVFEILAYYLCQLDGKVSSKSSNGRFGSQSALCRNEYSEAPKVKIGTSSSGLGRSYDGVRMPPVGFISVKTVAGYVAMIVPGSIAYCSVRR